MTRNFRKWSPHSFLNQLKKFAAMTAAVGAPSLMSGQLLAQGASHQRSYGLPNLHGWVFRGL